MPRAVSDFQDPGSLDERDDAQHPILPSAQRDGRGNQIIRERELVIEQAEEKAQESFHA